jgi:hypothetical protein
MLAAVFDSYIVGTNLTKKRDYGAMKGHIYNELSLDIGDGVHLYQASPKSMRLLSYKSTKNIPHTLEISYR